MRTGGVKFQSGRERDTTRLQCAHISVPALLLSPAQPHGATTGTSLTPASTITAAAVRVMSCRGSNRSDPSTTSDPRAGGLSSSSSAQPAGTVTLAPGAGLPPGRLAHVLTRDHRRYGSRRAENLAGGESHPAAGHVAAMIRTDDVLAPDRYVVTAVSLKDTVARDCVVDVPGGGGMLHLQELGVRVTLYDVAPCAVEVNAGGRGVAAAPVISAVLAVNESYTSMYLVVMYR